MERTVFRPLLPRGGDDSASSTKRRGTSACEPCRKKRSKCDGNRPACFSCIKRGVTCAYIMLENETRLAALKRENAELEHRIATLEEAPEHKPEPKPGFHQAVSTQDATLQKLDNLLNTFFDIIGKLFYVTKRDEVFSTLESLRAAGHEGTPLVDLVTLGDSVHLRTQVSELAGMAAIGVVHAQLTNPVSSPPIELADHLYTIARYGLDYAVQQDPLRAMKLAALLSMYNIVVHATVALTYADLGVSLGHRYGVKSENNPPSISTNDMDDHRRTYRTLIHLQCWLNASLDCSPASTSCLQNTPEVTHGSLEDTIREECIKVTIIKAKIIHQTPIAGGVVVEATIADIRRRLSDFYARLPPLMSLGRILEYDFDSPVTHIRPLLFYAHVFYLSAMMLLARRLIIIHTGAQATQPPIMDSQASRAIEEGYVAAQIGVRVLSLMLSEGRIIQVCWLCIYTAYTAGIMTLHHATRRALHALSYADSVELVRKSVAVLAYCAQRDDCAQLFHDSLQDSLHAFEEDQRPVEGATSPSSAPEPSLHHVLFGPCAGMVQLHSIARDLLHVICHPLDSLSSASTRALFSNQAEIIMGTHLEWEWELRNHDHSSRGTSQELNEGNAVAEVGALFTSISPPPHRSPWVTHTPPAHLCG